jgi:hypothetical protein
MEAATIPAAILTAVEAGVRELARRYELEYEVLGGDAREEDDWLYIPVRLVPAPRSLTAYDELGQIEDRIKTDHSANVLLVPAV